MSDMQDKTLICSDCGREFTFTASEQDFFAKKGFSDPSRCPDCRAARRASRGGGDAYASGGERRMYPAVCAQCGKETEVPFQPRGDRPVYCSDCYQQMRGSSGGGGGRGRSGGGGGRDRDRGGYNRGGRW